ncbi:inner membrane protein YiaA [Erwinia sp. HR93]|uniref:inner membrane protein YiaA n=1 Tax=Erwinia sp. HR93 TaxID=3094840 RepID=UPI002ADEFC42|nr:inner membrane protein YiaA [Erwinia sp. HR93]MEA1063298.1 inner membrane protein YiaA [Erwinia sp. HR93]
MKTNTAKTSSAFNAMSWLALVGGIVVYLVGLWRSDMALNERGYYFAVMLLGLFASVSLQKTVRDRMEAIPTSHIYYVSCVVSFVISIILLAVGLWNATLLPSEKGFYAIAFFLCLFGAIAVQKNIRDSQQEDNEYSQPAARVSAETIKE